jgi:phosphatidylinositol 4-kinase A
MVLTKMTVSAYAWSPSLKKFVDSIIMHHALRITDLWKVIRGCVTGLNNQASQQALPNALSEELRTLLISSTHRIAKVRDIASKYVNRLITSFPSLMCDPPLVFAILEVLTLLRRACENEFMDEARVHLSPCYYYFNQFPDAV